MGVGRPDGWLRFCWATAPTSAELARLAQTLALRIGRYLERQGLLERDAENSYLTGGGLEAGPMDQLLGSSITYRIAIGPQRGRKVLTLQTLPACDESFNDGVGKVAGFSLHAGVAARADERKKLERLCRYVSLFAASSTRQEPLYFGARKAQDPADEKRGQTDDCRCRLCAERVSFRGLRNRGHRYLA